MQTDIFLLGSQAAGASTTSTLAGSPTELRSKGGVTPGSGLLSGSDSAAEPLPFSGVLQAAITNLHQLESHASRTIEGLITGQGVDIHEAMIATQKSDLAFETALAVRGKAVAAYQALMGVQF